MLDKLKDDIAEKVKIINEKEAKIESMQRDFKRLNSEKVDKESLIKSTILNIFIISYSFDLRKSEIGK